MSVTGEKIKQLRLERGLTQKQLAERSGVIETTIRKYEIGSQNPKTENLQKIAAALGVPAHTLMDTPEAKAFLHDCFWSVDLEEKLKHIGYCLGSAEGHEEWFQWIKYPDGTLEVTDDELKELNDSADSFLRFKLAELKEKHKDHFHPKK